MPEPWLRETRLDCDPAAAAAIFALDQASEDIVTHTAGLTEAQVWCEPLPNISIGFDLRHIAGSLDRLSTYLAGRELNEAQLAALKRETEPGATLAFLRDEALQAIARAQTAIRTLPREEFAAPRYVGRRHIQTTAMGLVIHMAEHTQRHIGRLILLCRLAADA